MHRSHKNQRGLPEWQQQRNAEIRAGASVSGEGVWDAKTELWVRARPLLWAAAKRRRDVDETDSVQPEEGGGTDGIGQDTEVKLG